MTVEAESRGRIVMRCSASLERGLGHVSRCANLARALAKHDWHTLFLLDADTSVLPDAWRRELKFTEIADEPGSPGDAAATCRWMSRTRADWLVVDSYSAEDDYLLKVASDTHRLCVLDDYSDRRLSKVDLVVNPSLGAESWAYPYTDATVLAGVRFSLLHSAFRRARERREMRDWAEPPRFLVTMGGTDPRGLTGPVVNAVRSAIPNAEITAVVRRENAPAGIDADRLLHGVSPDIMAEEMRSCDFAIATPSTTAWELACVGTPAAFLVAADNQLPAARALTNASLAPVLPHAGALASVLGSELSATNEQVASRLSRWKNLCDGLGAERVAQSMNAYKRTNPASSRSNVRGTDR